MDALPALTQQLDPFALYRSLRDESPVLFDAQRQAWNVFRYDDVQRVLSDHHVFSSQLAGSRGPGQGGLFASSLISTDPPRHRQLRSLVTQAFTPRAVDALAPRITEISDELLGRAAAAGEMDLIDDFAYPLPVIVIAELMGIPPEDRDRFRRWSDVVVSQTRAGAPAPAAGHSEAQEEMGHYFLDMIEHRRSDPGEDLISRLLAAQIEGEHLSVPELLGFCALLLVAGNETTTNLLGNAVLTFLERPHLVERLRADGDALPAAVEEVLRFRSPVQSMYRIAAQDVTLSGQQIPAGARLVAWIGSANHDERQFPAPEEFDIDRTPNRHLAFGQGIHFCLGAPLARLEARIALTALLRGLPGLALRSAEDLTRMDSSIVYGLKHLPVAWATT
ncbi:cytochrome P450 [Sinomonas humi]|uniref:Cytochrome P450 n=1 Tax=Sinomonas humi TaxID=1338436 RepID=A0A0B2AR05_9MICC|nr:cytochrome P450 [Sinomonas humi]KHL04372.1 cytochrome P450 [Sinomonas humi]